MTSEAEPTRRQLAADAGIAIAACVFSVLILTAIGDQNGGGGPGAGAIALAALSTLPLAARRYAPVAVVIFTALASTALHATTDAGPPIGPTIAIYWLAAGGDGTRERTRNTLALVGALLVVHVAANAVRESDVPVTESLFGILVWGGAWLAGDRTRLRRERLTELQRRAEEAEREAERERRLAAAEERTRIARDLHDSAGHAINVILVHAGAGRLHVQRDPEAALDAFATIEEVARETVGEIDQMVGALRDGAAPSAEAVEPPGLAALESLVERHRTAGLDVSATVEASHHVPAGVDRGAFRILQEALTNAARHGDGSARVEVAEGERALDLIVENPLAPGAPTRPASGHGLVGMQERAELLGGSLHAGAENGSFRVHARLPFEEARS